MILGERVKERRLALGLTQLDVGKALGHDYSQYAGDIERGKIRNLTIATLSKLAGVLKCTESYLLGKERNTDEAA